MKKFLSGVGLVLCGVFLAMSQAHADIPAPSGVVGVLQQQPVEARITIVLLGAALIIAFVILISWLILRAIKRKKNGTVK